MSETKIDIIKLFDENRIEHKKCWEHKSVTKGWVNICCPFCPNDVGFHLGFSLKDNYFVCWKCGHHSLYSVFKTILPNDDYKVLLKRYESFFMTKQEREIVYKNSSIIIPGNKKPLKYHVNYIKKRKFDLHELIRKYDLRFTDHIGQFKFRLVFPIYFQSKIVSYQTRDVSNLSDMRYITCAKPKEIVHHKEILYNYDNCHSDNILLVEGIFDSIRIGDNSCATFGVSEKWKQLKLLRRFKRVFILFDNDEAGIQKAEKVEVKLKDIGVDCEVVEIDVEDPASMEQSDVFYLKKYLNII